MVHGELIIAPTRERPMLALKAGGRGDVTKSHVLWSFDNGPDVPTPVTDGTYLYVVNDRGIMFCLDAKTGKEIYGRQRLRPGTYSGSPVLADGKIYITNEDGVTSVVKAGPAFEVLAENDFDDYTLSSPAISSGTMYFRTTKFLWAIGSKPMKILVRRRRRRVTARCRPILTGRRFRGPNGTGIAEHVRRCRRSSARRRTCRGRRRCRRATRRRC